MPHLTVESQGKHCKEHAQKARQGKGIPVGTPRNKGSEESSRRGQRAGGGGSGEEDRLDAQGPLHGKGSRCRGGALTAEGCSEEGRV